METPTRAAILYQLVEVSKDMVSSRTTGDVIDARWEADRLLDLYIDLGYQSTKKLVPPLGWEGDG